MYQQCKAIYVSVRCLEQMMWGNALSIPSTKRGGLSWGGVGVVGHRHNLHPGDRSSHPI